MAKLSEPRGAKAGYGIGFAGTTQALAGNIKWDGPDLPFSDPMSDVPWGEAVLCTGKVTGNKLTLTKVGAGLIHGVCYGTTIKDCSVQLNAGISIAPLSASVTAPKDADDGLYIAILANAVIGDDGAMVMSDGHTATIMKKEGDPATMVETVVPESGDATGVASTVVAVSEAIDPTVFSLENNTMNFVIPKATAGYKFVVTGTLLKAPHFSDPGAYCSMKDTVSSYPTALSIVDAKTNA